MICCCTRDAGEARERPRRPARGWSFALAVLSLLCAAGGVATAQAPDAGAATTALDDDEQVAPDSPRASLAQFLELGRAGRFAEAARYLDLPRSLMPRGAELARRLQAVLDRHAWVDLALISPLSEGKADDGLPRGNDEVARIPGPGGKPEPLRLVRRNVGGGTWIFSRATVNRIDPWYERLEHRWVLEHLPDPLLRRGPADLLYWQWLALPLLVLVAWALGFVMSRLTRRVLARLAKRTSTLADEEVLGRVGRPLTFAWTLAAIHVLLPWLGLYQPAGEFIHRVLRGGFLVIFFWILARAIDVARQVMADSPWALNHPASRSLVPLGARVSKVLVVAIAVVALFSELGYPVASLVAGLGIGGLAVALAAQKTVENLFGAFSLGADQPFREGDFVRVEDFVGTVESIGLRSTRFRTLDRTLISIPNGKVAEMRLESFAVRDRLRLACIIALVYGTTASQMREVLAGFERILREHPKIWPDNIIVRLQELGSSSLNIEVMAWFQTTEWNEFQLIRQEVLLEFMAAVEKAGTAFAMPTRTVHIINESGARADG